MNQLNTKVILLRQALFDTDEVMCGCVEGYPESAVRKKICSALDKSQPGESLTILDDYKTQERPSLEEIIAYWNKLQRTAAQIDEMWRGIELIRKKDGLPPLDIPDDQTLIDNRASAALTTTDWIPALAAESIASFFRAMFPKKKYENFFDMAKRVGKPKRAKDRK